MLPPVAPTPAPAAAPVDDPFYDPALDRGRKTDKRRKVGFNFVQEGSFQREAELFRCEDRGVCVADAVRDAVKMSLIQVQTNS